MLHTHFPLASCQICLEAERNSWQVQCPAFLEGISLEHVWTVFSYGRVAYTLISMVFAADDRFEHMMPDLYQNVRHGISGSVEASTCQTFFPAAFSQVMEMVRFKNFCCCACFSLCASVCLLGGCERVCVCARVYVLNWFLCQLVFREGDTRSSQASYACRNGWVETPR